jgi:ppGpp synthetase/RelA/SpoT-type nucleotidyltranferase
MSLPVSKTALDRLGGRLIAGDQVMEADRVALAHVVGAYQQALDEAKARLVELGYPATTRVKTTGTLIEKLRREARMRLSQVQDLAGARIVVRDRRAQDEAQHMIREDCEAAGRPCKVSDRRDRPSHGYRAVHIIMQWDQIPVEVQIRTELQDTWAQMMERVADQWGRGIRYGEDPDSLNESAEALGLVETRRETVALLTSLGDSIAQAEVMRAQAEDAAASLNKFGEAVEKLGQSRGGDLRITRDVIPSASLDVTIEGLGRLSPEALAIMDGGRDMTVAKFVKTLHQVHEMTQRKNDDRRKALRHLEERIQAQLQRIADMADRMVI